jgi:hypothetical protein
LNLTNFVFILIFLGISYKKLLDLEVSLASSVKKHTDSNGQYCIPRWVVKNQYPFFGADNIDFLEKVTTGNSTFHGAILVIFQKKTENCSFFTAINRKKDKESNSSLDFYYSLRDKPVPLKKPQQFIYETNNKESEIASPKDLLWYHSNIIENSDPDSTLTWGSFNSLISERCQLTNVGPVAPLLRSSPTDYSTFLSLIMRAKSITEYIMGDGYKTVMSFDLQLYDMAMKLWCSDPLIESNFLFRPGELHTVFASLSALGKYIEGSGLDQAWTEAGMYGPATVNRVLDGKTYYLAIEAHTITVMALYEINYNRKCTTLDQTARTELTDFFIEFNIFLKENLRFVADHTTNYEKILVFYEKLQKLVNLDFFEIKSENPTKTEIFLSNYVKQFQCIMKYIRATRENNIDLHLEATEDLMKYFFAHNNLNYARLLSLYLCNMETIKHTDKTIWNELQNGNLFSVSKNGNLKYTS